MEIKLVMPCEKYWNSYFSSYREMDHHGLVKGMDWDGVSTPEEYFKIAHDMRDGVNLGELVQATNFWIIGEGEYLGRMSIRHELNEWLRNYGGHIGYEIKTSARRKGYATAALKEAIQYCKRELKLKELLLTCDDQNIASYKTIETNKGILIKKKE